MLTIVTGMKDEADTIINTDNVQVLWGTASKRLNTVVARGCTGIISFGVAGALVPSVGAGDLLIGTSVVMDNEKYICDAAWTSLIHKWVCMIVPRAYGSAFYSDGAPGAFTAKDRAALYNKYAAWAIDDESIEVARFAHTNNIPFAVVRAISDDSTSDIPPWVLSIVNENGSFDPYLAAQHIGQMDKLVKMGLDYGKALDTLRKCYKQIGPYFLFQEKTNDPK